MLKSIGKVLLLLSLVIIALDIHCQERLTYQSDYGYVYPNNPDEIVLISNVVFTHKDWVMYCDSAVFNQKENYFFGYSHIRIIQNDSTQIKADELHYFGNDKLGELFGEKVILTQGSTTLTTTYLYLDRNQGYVQYTQNAKTIDKKDTLTSEEGTYYYDDKYFVFHYNVVLLSDKDTINTDTLFYYKLDKKASCFGPTVISCADTTKAFVLQADYFTNSKQINSTSRSKIDKIDQYFLSDILFYDKKNKNGYAYGNLHFEDTTQKINLFCDTILLTTIDTISWAKLFGSLIVRQVEDTDTLYLHSDTMIVKMDTNFELKDIFGKNNNKMFRSDIQALCEYYHYNNQDSILTMLSSPILWTQATQLTGDTIQMTISNKKIKFLYISPNCFVVQRSDSNINDFYNQIKGRTLRGYFDNNKLQTADIDGNTHSVYYIWDENKQKKERKLTGVNIGISKLLHLKFKNGKLKQMTAIVEPEFYMDDMTKLTPKDYILEGFEDKEFLRPKTKGDILIYGKHTDKTSDKNANGTDFDNNKDNKNLDNE